MGLPSGNVVDAVLAASFDELHAKSSDRDTKPKTDLMVVFFKVFIVFRNCS